ncbi:MAG: hypothetical protein Q8P28_06185 [Deltaproteobacteria bacterium]|nr:hypothetical protein [Deltaproteobacteria bacterium]
MGQTDQPDCLETCCCRADFERKLGRKWKYDAKAVAEQSRVGWVELCETQQTIAINRWVEKRNPTYALATNGLIIAIQVLRE